MRRFIADTNQKGNFFNVTPARILDLAFFAGSPRPGLVLEIGDWMLYPLLPQIDRLRGWAGYPCSGDEAIPEGSKWAEIPLLGEKKEKKIPCGKKKPYGPVHWYFWAILWSSDFRSFFSYDSPILDFSLYSPRMFPPLCALFSRLPILAFPTREETVYGFPPRQMPIGHQLPRGRSGQ